MNLQQVLTLARRAKLGQSESPISIHLGDCQFYAIRSSLRVLLASDDPRAARAIDLFVYRIGRELGSLAAALGGLDALIFTAGIGEHAAEIRRRVLEGARWLGVDLDATANAVGSPASPVPEVASPPSSSQQTRI